MSIFALDPRDPYHRAESLADLCAHPDLDFVRCAYVTILGRQPDPEGEAYFAARVRAGESKLSILRELRLSDEGRRHDPGIAGLDKALRQHRNANLPVIGRFVRWVTKREGDGPIERRLRVIEDREALAAKQATSRFLHLNHLIHELDGSVAAIRRDIQQISKGSEGSTNSARQLASSSSNWSAALSDALKS
jgi:methyl-accepting chemotaxis protein